MVYISKIYTKFGDTGETMLADGQRVAKDDARIRSYGEIDELNAIVGIVRTELAREPKRMTDEDFATALDGQLGRIQQELFNLGAELATPHAARGEASLVIEERHVLQLEHDIDHWNDTLEPLKSFILPGGGPVAASAHLARTVCRRAERELFALARREPVRGEAMRYVNRLSDYFFVVSRIVSHRLGYDEVLWDPKST